MTFLSNLHPLPALPHHGHNIDRCITQRSAKYLINDEQLTNIILKNNLPEENISKRIPVSSNMRHSSLRVRERKGKEAISHSLFPPSWLCDSNKILSAAFNKRKMLQNAFRAHCKMADKKSKVYRPRCFFDVEISGVAGLNSCFSFIFSADSEIK